MQIRATQTESSTYQGQFSSLILKWSSEWFLHRQIFHRNHMDFACEGVQQVMQSRVSGGLEKQLCDGTRRLKDLILYNEAVPCLSQGWLCGRRRRVCPFLGHRNSVKVLATQMGMQASSRSSMGIVLELAFQTSPERGVQNEIHLPQ